MKYKKNIYTLLCSILCSLSVQLIASEKNISKNNPLIFAIQQNNEELVERYLKNGVSANSEDEHGNHAIHLAMEWDTEPYLHKQRIFNPNIVKTLLKYKANPNALYNFKKATPLHAAVFHNSPEIVIELLYYGANKDACDTRGITPLELAKHYKYDDITNILSHTVPPLPIFLIEEEIKSFYLIEQFTITISAIFSAKKIIDDYLPSTDTETQ